MAFLLSEQVVLSIANFSLMAGLYCAIEGWTSGPFVTLLADISSLAGLACSMVVPSSQSPPPHHHAYKHLSITR